MPNAAGVLSDSDILNYDPNKYLSGQQHINQLMTSHVTYKPARVRGKEPRTIKCLKIEVPDIERE